MKDKPEREQLFCDEYDEYIYDDNNDLTCSRSANHLSPFVSEEKNRIAQIIERKKVIMEKEMEELSALIHNKPNKPKR